MLERSHETLPLRHKAIKIMEIDIKVTCDFYSHVITNHNDKKAKSFILLENTSTIWRIKGECKWNAPCMFRLQYKIKIVDKSLYHIQLELQRRREMVE